MTAARHRRLLRRTAPWAVGLACVVAAWFVALATPADTAAWEPFIVEARAGEPAAGRNLVVTVHDAVRAESVSSGGWRAEGTWVVVDIAAEAVVSERGSALSSAQLLVDGRTYRATERAETMLGDRLSIGLPREGSLGFELPADARGAAVLQLALNPDTRADSVIAYRIDLDDLPVVSERELVGARWSETP
ncbi:hypothetical protein [Microbacterium oleivorans]|uniref:DUF4352 domain-containing protein n=1 Tax=Microbacterium oleivorans TaxID=273677 RepID=A0A7D5ISD5_9MICO|nr:hypothetical protein [Microbacterium oleivorans]QLD11497.1 hypothetical protein HW566_06755 [Microbacterium oleivorans]